MSSPDQPPRPSWGQPQNSGAAWTPPPPGWQPPPPRRKFKLWQIAGMGCGGFLGLIMAISVIGAIFASPGKNTPASTPTAHPTAAVSTTSTAPADKASAAVSASAPETQTDTPSAAAVAPPSNTPTVTPTTHTPIPAKPTPQAPSPTQNTASGCYPLSSHGTCYRAGEYCPNADHGMTGTDANGNAIECVDNNGWRWEHV